MVRTSKVYVPGGKEVGGKLFRRPRIVGKIHFQKNLAGETLHKNDNNRIHQAAWNVQ